MTQPINRRVLAAGGLAGGLAFAARAVLAQPVPAAADTGLVRVVIKTGKGQITLDLNVGKAPITAKNFLRYVDTRRFDGSSFYRASPIKDYPNLGIIEGGLQSNPAKVFKPIAFESTIKTGLSHKDGTISMAADGPGTAQADFFICAGDQPSFDADPANPAANPGFAAFGQVVDGMDTVRAILDSPKSEHARVAIMRGQMLAPPVPIISVRRVG
jgi:peptidyl-prolyl cis-trans isomerase A (cyclophilin A)